MSKLALYKQAPNPDRRDEKCTHKGPRHGLIQGRLIASGDTSFSASISQSAEQHERSMVDRSSGYLTTQQRSPSPSRQKPSMCLEHSPRPVQPLKALELSDESDNDSKGPLQSEVMVVDASMVRQSEDTEVEVTVGLEKPTHKVVCHSPRAVQENMRGGVVSGSVDDAKAVPVERVPTVLVGNGEESADQAVAMISRLYHEQRMSDEASHSKRGQADTERPSRPAPMMRLFDQLSVADESDEAFEDLVLDASHSVAAKTEGATSSKQRPSEKEVKKKRKGSRTVASRYMQAPASVKPKGPMKATDRSILTKSSSILAASKAATVKKSKKKTTSSITEGRENSELNTTPVLHGSSKKTSTPTMHGLTPGADSSLFHGFDASAIAPATDGHSYTDPESGGRKADNDTILFANKGGSGVKTSKTVSRIKGHSKDSSMGHSTGHSSLSSTGSNSYHGHSIGKQVGKEVMQQDLELLYARYLQWLFLNSSARKAFKEQEKQVMAQLHGLQEENDKLEKRKAEQDLLLAKMGHAEILDEALDLQEEGLEGVVPSLSGLEQQYGSLAAGLDTTRHQLAVSGVLVPDDQDTYSAQLQAALGESEQLLGGLASRCRHKQADVTACADAMDTLRNTLQIQAEEMLRSQELLGTAETLATEESSLLIQNIQNQQEAQLML